MERLPLPHLSWASPIFAEFPLFHILSFLGSWSLVPRLMPAIAEGTGEQVAVQSHFRAVNTGLRNWKPASAHFSFDLAGATLGQGLSAVLVSTIIRKGSCKSHLGRHPRTVPGKGTSCLAQVSALHLSFIKPYIRYLSSFIMCV